MKLHASAAALPLALLLVAALSSAEGAPPRYRIAERAEIDRVPSWFPVGFSLLGHGSEQYAAYYDSEHRLVVARRRLGEKEWRKVTLPQKVGWDSHNYVTMAIDDTGQVHLAGNMHCVPLVYFRTAQPGDIATFERRPMTGREEQRCTYPRFLRGAGGSLLFTYRSGGSGNGRRFYNRYDAATGAWSRFLDTPLFEGEGERNAYPLGPTRGPDGRFHVVWVWRDTPDCATNHHLSYARSRDLRHWESAGGKPARLPLTLDQELLWVDPVPSGGGIINGCERLAFDARRRPVIAYHKRDDRGRMQLWVTRFRGGSWERRALTDWAEPIPFSGGGAMPFIGIALSSFERVEGGAFVLRYRHRDHGSGRIAIDEETLRPVDREIQARRDFPAGLLQPRLSFPGLRVRIARDSAGEEGADTAYLLCWETLEAHQDRPRKPPLPPPSPLEIVRLERVR